jgi:hypothetical protein
MRAIKAYDDISPLDIAKLAQTLLEAGHFGRIAGRSAGPCG